MSFSLRNSDSDQGSKISVSSSPNSDVLNFKWVTGPIDSITEVKKNSSGKCSQFWMLK